MIGSVTGKILTGGPAHLIISSDSVLNTDSASSSADTYFWKRMNDFSKECGFNHKWPKDNYIPESLFYLSGFKAGNERVIKYQQWMYIGL